MLPNMTNFYDSVTSLNKASTCSGEETFGHPGEKSHPAVFESPAHSHSVAVTASRFCTLQHGKPSDLITQNSQSQHVLLSM